MLEQDNSSVEGPYFIEEGGACLVYFFENGRYLIDEIRSKLPGGGKKTVKEFVRRIGKDQPVCTGVIIEPDTRAKLHELGLLTQVEKTHRSLELTDQNIFKELKVARVLAGGGIIVEKVVIEPFEEQFRNEMSLDKDGCRVTVRIFGKTP